MVGGEIASPRTPRCGLMSYQHLNYRFAYFRLFLPLNEPIPNTWSRPKQLEPARVESDKLTLIQSSEEKNAHVDKGYLCGRVGLA